MVKSLGAALNRDFRNGSNDNFTEHENEIASLDNRVSNLVANAGNSNTEIVDARLPSTGSPFATLKERLDTNDNQVGIVSENEIHAESFKIQTPEVDDTARLNRAATALSVSGGRLLIAAKQYNVSNKITVPKNTQVFMKTGGKIVNTAAGLFGIFSVGNSSATTQEEYNVHFYNVTIEGTNTVGTVSTPKSEVGIQVDYAQGVTIENCTFSKMTIAAQFKYSIDCKFINNKVRDIVGYTGQSEGYGILCTGGGNHEIKGNTFRNVKRHCVYLSTGTKFNKVHHNWMFDSLKNPIQLYSRLDLTPMADATAYNHIHHNHIIGVTNSGLTGEGQGIVAIAYAQDNIIEDNYIKDTQDEGIKLTSEAPSRPLDGSSNPDYTNYRNQGNIVRGNKIINASTGIYVKIADGTEIIDNTIQNPTANGITIAAFGNGTNVYADNTVIKENRIIGAAGTGLQIAQANARYTVVKNNEYRNNATDFSDGGTFTKNNEYSQKIVGTQGIVTKKNSLLSNGAVHTIPLNLNGAAMILINCSEADRSGAIAIGTGSTTKITKMYGWANLGVLSNTVLTGSTGTSGNINVSYANGNLYIENRFGFGYTYSLTVVGD